MSKGPRRYDRVQMVRMDAEMLAALRKLAKVLGVKRAALARRFIAEGLERRSGLWG